MSEGAPVRLVAPVPPDEDAAVTMAQGRSRPAWAEIDLAAVAHNAAVLARLVAPAELCAVVKAHGYGHGGPAVARAALTGGAGRLAVALVDEGVELREHGVTAPVLLLSECDPAAAGTALSYGLTPTLYSARRDRRLQRGRGCGRPAGRRARQGRHRDAPGGRGARGPARHRGGRGGGSAAAAREHLDAPAGGRRCRRGGPCLHGGTARPLRPARRRAGRGRHPDPAAARRQHGGRHRLPALALRHGALRARPVRLPPGPRGPGGLCRTGGRRATAPGDGAQGTGRGGALARRRGAPVLRPAAPPADGLADRHRPDRLRRRRAPEPLRRRLRGPHRRRAPSPGRRGDHGPDHGRLRRRPGPAGRRGGVARTAG